MGEIFQHISLETGSIWTKSGQWIAGKERNVL